nr:hypothetical protein [uncultured archaeon]
MKSKKIVLFFICVLFLSVSSSAFAMTQAEKDVLIQQIIQQINALQTQINQTVAQQNTGANWCHTFNVNMGYAGSGTNEVSYLHTALQKENISYSPDGINSYTQATGGAILQFQARYGILQTGYVGPLTRAKLNQLYGCFTANASSPLSLIYPNGGQTLHVGDTARITWKSIGLTSSDYVNITVYMPSDPYVNVKTITGYVPATQEYYDWNIIGYNLPSTSYPVNLRVKISVRNKDISISSASDFTINSITSQGLGSISLVYPNGGQVMQVGDSSRITWTTTGLSSSDKVTISVYSPLNPNSNVKTIASSVSATQGYYDWNISTSTLPSTSYPVSLRVKIDVSGKNISTSSASDFTINSGGNSDASSISLTYPNGGQILYVGDSSRITWTSIGLSSSDKITISVYSPSNPNSNVKTIVSSVSATQGYYDWNISTNTLPSTSYPVSLRVKIDVSGKNISTSSASDITVNSGTNQGSASISIVYPNGGETMQVGDIPRITWTTIGFASTDRVTITTYMPSNPYLNIKTITSSVLATQGYYDWSITKYNLPSTSYPVSLRVKIESPSKNISTSSASDFTVNGPPAS